MHWAQVNPATVLAFFDMMKIPAGEFLIQSAANSSLGKQVIALAKHKNVKTINVVRRAQAKEELLKLGCAIPLKYISFPLRKRDEEVLRNSSGSIFANR